MVPEAEMMTSHSCQTCVVICELQTCLKPQLQELAWESLFILERCHDFKKRMLKYVQYTYMTYCLLNSGEVEFDTICFIFVCEQNDFL